MPLAAPLDSLTLLAVFHALPGAYLLLSPELIIEEVSAGYLAETLTTREQLLGCYLFDAFPDNPQAQQAHAVRNLRASLEQVLATRQPQQMDVQHYDVPHPQQPGQFVERYWLPTNTPILDAEGRVCHLLHSVVNVTDQQRAQAQLGESQRREQATQAHAGQLVRATLDSSTAIIQVFDAVRDDAGRIVDFRWTLVNKQASAQYETDLVGQRLLALNPGVVETGIFARFVQVVESDQPQVYEQEYRHEQYNGWFEQSVVKLGDGVVSTTTDITARKQAEQALQAAHARTVDILESTTDAFYALDADFRFTYVNQRAACLWGRERDELLGRHYWTEFPKAVGSDAYHRHYEVLRTGQPAHYETVSPLLGIWVDTIIYPGREGGVSVFFRDVTARKQTEAALRTSQAQLAAVFDALPVGVGVFDVQGRLTLANRRMQHYLPTGVMPSRDAGQAGRWRAYHADGRPLHPAEFPGARALRGEKVVPGTEMLYQHDDDQEVWTQVSAVPLPDRQGHVTVIVDIDALKRADEALQASEQRLRALIENLPGGAVFVVDQQLRYQLAEGEALHQAGLVPADLLGRPVREVMPPALWAQQEPHYRAALAGQAFAMELEAYGRAFLTRGLPLRDAAGQIEAALAVSYDITDRQRAEAALRQSQERLQQALSIETVGVIFFDLQGGIHDANAAFERMSGFSREDFVSGRVRWDEVTPPEFMDVTRRSQHELRTQGQNTPYEKQYIRPDGSRWWGRFAGKRLSSGECVEFVLDITASKQAQRQLQESQQQLEAYNTQLQRTNVDLDNFIYTASHDLKAPITNIEGLLYALQEQLPAEVQQTYDVRPLLGMMAASVQRFLRTIEHLSDVVKLQQVHAGDAAEVALLPVIEEVRRDLRPQLAAAGAHVQLNVPEGTHVLFSVKNLRSVVYNLLSNAVKYRHPDRVPQVHITCRQQAQYTVLTVQDNGLGIEPGKHTELFQMFRRLHSHVPGSGIGLFMVKRIVENAGGRVEVQSEPAVGSCFTVYFPRGTSR